MTEKTMNWHLESTYCDLPNTFYEKVKPTKVENPTLLLLNEKLAEQLGLNSTWLQSEENIEVFSGNRVIPETTPIAQAYGGHQYGHFTMLGDGRAILLGEKITQNNERVDIVLKGAGLTRYSRGGDGRAAVGPMLREYIISEAMYALGIPSTRSLAVVATGEELFRNDIVPGAVLTRIAASHIRVGTFQFAAAWRTLEERKALLDYTIHRHYPHVEDCENKYLLFLEGVIDAQAQLLTKWQSVGFVHGVMNTDNMTISGESIDYGPCAFLDTYAKNTVFSSIDRNGRYAYGNQPYIAGWNLARFAETLLPFLHEDEETALEIAQAAIAAYGPRYEEYWLQIMGEKIGLEKVREDDRELIDTLFLTMESQQLDFTNTFVHLTQSIEEKQDMSILTSDWLTSWRNRLAEENQSLESVVKRMKAVNPYVIPRNYYVEQALKAATNGNLDFVHALLQAIEKPFEYNEMHKQYTKVPKSDGEYVTFCGT
ncbi:MAG: protein adenylyltransferase SelO [Bacilli bacterium]